MRTRRSRAEISTIHMWLWWATFTMALGDGSNALSAYKAAQRATARLYA